MVSDIFRCINNLLKEKKRLTREEYLSWEETAVDKYEFENGEIFALYGGTADHSLIAGNVITALNNALAKRECRVFGSDVKVEIQVAEAYVYPDAIVICGKVEFVDSKKSVIKNPVLIVEVLSTSTESYDQGKKFKKYQTLPSFREYILISQIEPLVETFVRQEANHWLYTVTEGTEALVQFQAIESNITLQDIYRKVEWEEEKAL